MKTFGLLLTAALSAWAGSAQSADMITKAPQLAYPTTKCGGYLGVNTEGSAANVPGAPPGTIVTGGTIGGLAGYACPTAVLPWFVEGIADWQNLNAGNNGFSLTGPFHGEARIGVQTDIFQYVLQLLPGTGNLSALPTPTPPALPPGATPNGPMTDYFYGAFNADDISSSFGLASARAWLFSPEFGMGILVPVKLANGKPIVLDAWLGDELQTNSMCLGTVTCAKLGNRWKVGAAVKF